MFPTPVWNSGGLRLTATPIERINAEAYITK